MSRLELAEWRRRTQQLYAEVRTLRSRDPQAAHAHWRVRRDELFKHHPESPLPAAERERFPGLPVWSYEPAFAMLATVDETVGTQRFPISTSTGQELAFSRFAVARCSLGSLDLFWLEGYSGGLFLPFRDATSGEQTYGGGRYLLDTAKGVDLGTAPSGRLVLDFNFAYHPSCHYHPRWSCPLAPPGGNTLSVAVMAGERAR